VVPDDGAVAVMISPGSEMAPIPKVPHSHVNVITAMGDLHFARDGGAVKHWKFVARKILLVLRGARWQCVHMPHVRSTGIDFPGRWTVAIRLY
jgi:hypothetical protein